MDRPSVSSPSLEDALPAVRRDDDPSLWLRELYAKGNRRQADWDENEREHSDQLQKTEKLHRKAQGELSKRLDEERQQAHDQLQSTRQSILHQFDQEYGRLDKEFADKVTRVKRNYDIRKKESKEKHREARWTTSTFSEERRKELREEKTKNDETGQQLIDSATQVWKSTCQQLEKWGRMAASLPSESESAGLAVSAGAIKDEVADYDDPVKGHLAKAKDYLQSLKQLKTPGLLVGPGLLMYVMGLGALGVALAWVASYVYEISPWYGIAGVGVATAVGGAVSRMILWSRSERQINDVIEPLRQHIALAMASIKKENLIALGEVTEQREQLKKSYAEEMENHQREYRQSRTQQKRDRQQSIAELDDHYLPLLNQLQSERDEKIQQIDSSYTQQQKDLQTRFEQRRNELESQYTKRCQQIEQAYQKRKVEITQQWRQVAEQLHHQLTSWETLQRQQAPDWEDGSWDHWGPPEHMPSHLRVGHWTVDFSRSATVRPDDPAMQVGPDHYELPAVVRFPEESSVVLSGPADGRRRMDEALQGMMMRSATLVPPGRLRFVVLDPVGLGQSFASFMRLADFDERLVGSRIWSEPNQIEQQLTDLTEHMQNVIQKYLRDEFDSIEEFNQQAGELAEPYRMLVVANFPHNFTDVAVQRLVSILASGRRCGVHVLMSVETGRPLPADLKLAELTEHAMSLKWQAGKFTWKDHSLNKFPLSMDSPAPTGLASRLLTQVGESAKANEAVKLSFSLVSPNENSIWTQSSAQDLQVALGRSGATQNLVMTLGHGTAQHMLVAGKTGSGKSSLLHVLITNAAMNYGPDQLELYLIDFKKGVEFKAYATGELPHARVVAVASEREFGVSVMERLDRELTRRGELFRQAGVQDLAGYRQAKPEEIMPRVLLIVDEFQEFFVEDDALGQKTSLLLDRLVRQGRAFGLHVILGSQTLGGAYSLPRATLGQMALRVALPCGEADAALILDENNTAARLLHRPGEAIFNDAGGQLEGNKPFQVVWLDENRRDEILEDMRHRAEDRQFRAPSPTIVFEGTEAAQLESNRLLGDLIDQPAIEIPSVPLAWLGEAIAIKDPTAARLAPQAGRNLLMVGQNRMGALGALAASTIGLALQSGPGDDGNSTSTTPAGSGNPSIDDSHDDSNDPLGTDDSGNRATTPQAGSTPKFFVLDGSPIDAHHAGYLTKLGDVLGADVTSAGPRNVGSVLETLSQEVTRRADADLVELTPWYVTVLDLGRFRDLRRDEDDYGFGDSDKVTPAKQFLNILREGPAVRVHVLVWCDSINNLHRTFDRAALREFELKVLFQMSGDDSSQLIDTPSASRLGPQYAYFYDEERGELEKFRPYGLPSAAWIDSFRHKRDRSGRRPVSSTSPPKS